MGNCLRRRTSRRGPSERTSHAPESSPAGIRMVPVFFPNQHRSNERICACQSAVDFKANCAANLPNPHNCEVVLMFGEGEEPIVMNDEDEFGDKLFLFDHIIIRERQDVDLGNQDMDNAIRIKRRN